MSERHCDECGKRLITHRADARFCDERCRARFNNKKRVASAPTDIRIAGDRRGEGSRGGNIRSVHEAWEKQAEQKAKRDWAGAIDEQIRRTLLETGYYHADDLDALGIPPEHCNLKGSRAAWFRNRKLMESTGVYRKVAHAAANGRKAPTYRIAAKGRRELPKLRPGESTAGVGSDNREGIVARESGGPLDRPGASIVRATSNGARCSVAADPGEQSAPTGDPSSTDRSDKPEPVPSASGSSGSSSAVTSHAAEEPCPTLFELAPEGPGHDRIAA